MRHWSPDLEDTEIFPRRLSFASNSVRVESSEGSEPSICVALVDIRSGAVRVLFGRSAAGPRDHEPSLEPE